MGARACEGKRCIDLYIAGDGPVPCALGPAYKLTHNQDKQNWTLCGRQCHTCTYRSPASRPCTSSADACTLLHLRQEICKIGEVYVMSMEVEMPKSGSVWC